MRKSVKWQSIHSFRRCLPNYFVPDLPMLLWSRNEYSANNHAKANFRQVKWQTILFTPHRHITVMVVDFRGTLRNTRMQIGAGTESCIGWKKGIQGVADSRWVLVSTPPWRPPKSVRMLIAYADEEGFPRRNLILEYYVIDDRSTKACSGQT